MKKKRLIWILVIVFILLQSILFAIIAFRNLPNYDKNKQMKLFGQKLDKQNRLAYFNEYNFERLKDPNTGTIPDGIQSRVLNFVSMLPSRDDFLAITDNSQFNKIDTKQGMFNWQNIGPTNIGGRMNCVAYDISDPKYVLAGAASGGVWRSTDGGISWSKRFPANDNHTIYCLTQDTRKGKTQNWYAGSGELLSTLDRKVNTIARMSYYGDGIYKSTDNGTTWKLLPATQTPDVGKFTSKFQGVWNIVVEPTIEDKDIVYAACIGSIMKSTDGGESWKQVLGDNNNIAFSTDLVRAPDGRLFAAFSQISLNGNKPNHTGILVSSDKGETWENITPSGFPDTTKVIKLSVAPSNQNRLYVFVDKPIEGADPYSFPNSRLFLWKSDYNGKSYSWKDITSSLAPKSKEIMSPATLGGYAMCLSVKPDDENFVLLGGTSLYRSTDGFNTNNNVSMIGGYYWDEAIQGMNYQLSSQYLHPDIHGFTFHPTNPNAILVASDGGIYFSDNISFLEPSWQSRNQGLITSQFYSIAVGKTQNYKDVILGGLQDNGSFYTPQQGNVRDWLELSGADGMHTLINDAYNYGITSWYNGATVYVKFNPNTLEPINYYYLRPNKAPSSKFAFYNRFIVDPNNPNTLYLPALNSIYFNHQLMNCETNYQIFQAQWNIDPSKAFVFPQNEVITALAMPKSQFNTLYVGTRFGKIYRIKNANSINDASREEITSSGFPKMGWVSSIEYDEINKILLATFSNYGVLSIYASFDEGKSWQSVAGNLEENPDGSGAGPSVRWIKRVIVDNSEVYYFVATDAGLFSTNKLNGIGTIWYQEGKNTIGNVICEMVDAKDNNKVVVATQGNGVWVSDLSKLSVGNSLEDEFEIYPNPVLNKINISFKKLKNNDLYLSIYSYSGELKYINRYSINDIKYNKIAIIVSELAKGNYILLINQGNSVYKKKFIKF